MVRAVQENAESGRRRKPRERTRYLMGGENGGMRQYRRNIDTHVVGQYSTIDMQALYRSRKLLSFEFLIKESASQETV